MNELAPELTQQLLDQPQMSHDLHVARVCLANGRTFPEVAIANCAYVVAVQGHAFVPFDAQDVVWLQVTNRRWSSPRKAIA